MLILSRKVGEKVQIADNIVVTVTKVEGDRVSLGFEAPMEVAIHRQEVQKRIAHSARQEMVQRLSLRGRPVPITQPAACA